MVLHFRRLGYASPLLCLGLPGVYPCQGCERKPFISDSAKTFFRFWDLSGWRSLNIYQHAGLIATLIDRRRLGPFLLLVAE